MLPAMKQVSRTIGWKVGKDFELIPNEMNNADYLEMYERILMDLSMRVVGMLFKSDTEDVLRSIVFMFEKF